MPKLALNTVDDVRLDAGGPGPAHPYDGSVANLDRPARRRPFGP
jgi:hypothetical protein